MLNLAEAEAHEWRASDLSQNVFHFGIIGAAWKCHEVRSTTRSAITRSEVRDRDERLWELCHSLTPHTFEGFIRYRVGDLLHFSHGTQGVDVPVQCSSAPEMAPHARPQAPCSARAPDVKERASRQVILTQASDRQGLRTRDRQVQYIGAVGRRQVLKVKHDSSAGWIIPIVA